MDLFSAACENFGLVINTQKTVVMHHPPPNSATAPNASPQISVNGTQLQVVENFPYLGSTLSRNTKIDDEVANRISKAYLATCVSTTTCGRQPPVTPQIHSLPTSSTTTIITPEINTHTPHAPNCHLPRKWEVRISTRSPCGFGCRGDLSPRLSRHVKRRG
nr:unnamed protein product [Spirometra erinaceieuropaei]